VVSATFSVLSCHLPGEDEEDMGNLTKVAVNFARFRSGIGYTKELTNYPTPWSRILLANSHLASQEIPQLLYVHEKLLVTYEYLALFHSNQLTWVFFCEEW
jgi:hypothetical protein